MNVIIQSGNLTRDGELKALSNGTPCVEFTLAVSNRIQKNGEWVDEPIFLDCSIYGQRANALYSYGYFLKGKKAICKGRVKQDRWQDRETGKSRTKIRVVVDDIEFEKKQEQTTPTNPTYEQPTYSMPSNEVYDEEVPF